MVGWLSLFGLVPNKLYIFRCSRTSLSLVELFTWTSERTLARLPWLLILLTPAASSLTVPPLASPELSTPLRDSESPPSRSMESSRAPELAPSSKSTPSLNASALIGRLPLLRSSPRSGTLLPSPRNSLWEPRELHWLTSIDSRSWSAERTEASN